MKVYIDISVFTKESAIGRVSGNIDVPIVPEIGDTVDLGTSKEGHIEQPLVFGALLKVKERTITVDSDTEIAITLSDLTLATRDDAKTAMAYLESRYGLVAEYWDEENMRVRTPD